MFFQSIYAQYTLAGVNAVQVSLFKNKNALSSTYVGSQANPQGMSPFLVPVAELMTDSSTETNGLPTFIATATGITDQNPYWHLDFSASHTMAWSLDCMTTEFSNYPADSCAMEPVNGILGFDGAPISAGALGSFSNAKMGGYIVSGTKYTSKLCFGSVNCKYIELYGVDQVSGNNWNFGGDGAYGVLGMGPASFIWEGFVDPDMKRAYYSIALARISLYSDELDGASTVQSNLTFGATAEDWYVGKPSVYMTSLSNYTYAVQELGFGQVYQTNGVDSSEYFQPLDTQFPVEFNTNFKGLGLPSELYSQFVTLFEYITGGDAQCQNTVDGICTLPAPCVNYTALNEFYFKFNFTYDYSGNYMRVPLATFSQGVKVSGGAQQCQVYISYLNSNAPQSQNIILGGMFFQEFFGAFVNDYHDVQNIDQGVQIFVGQNSIYNGYVGNEVLPTGVNPFVPQPPSPPSDDGGLGTAWIVVISLIGAAVVGFLGFLLYKYKMATAQPRATDIVMGGNVNASGTATDVPKEEQKLLGV